MVTIQDNKLKGSAGDKVAFHESPNMGGKFKRKNLDTLVVHYTGSFNAQSAIMHLSNPRVKASAHVVIDVDGSMTQLVPFDTIAWHAGQSNHLHRKGLNKYAIGIELVNAGALKKQGDLYLSWFGQGFAHAEVFEGVHRNHREVSYWHRYTPEQIQAAEMLCDLLVNNYSIKHILGHEEISPARKVDPGPAFPLDKIRERILKPHRHLDGGEQGLEEAEASFKEDSTILEKGLVNVGRLNIRQNPDLLSRLAAEPLQKGTIVSITEEKADWYKVRVEIDGWVMKKYVKK